MALKNAQKTAAEPVTGRKVTITGKTGLLWAEVQGAVHSMGSSCLCSLLSLNFSASFYPVISF